MESFKACRPMHTVNDHKSLCKLIINLLDLNVEGFMVRVYYILSVLLGSRIIGKLSNFITVARSYKNSRYALSYKNDYSNLLC